MTQFKIWLPGIAGELQQECEKYYSRLYFLRDSAQALIDKREEPSLEEFDPILSTVVEIKETYKQIKRLSSLLIKKEQENQTNDTHL